MAADEAYERFLALVAEVPPEDDLPITSNEACTRLRLIDPILTEVLGWPRGMIDVEIDAGEGRLDYILRDSRGACWFVVEAKKRDRELVPKSDSRKVERLKLTGPVLKPVCWEIIDKQMPPYLGRFMPAYAAVTNGEQWIGFLGRRLPDTLDLSESHAVVFRSLDAIKDNFERFYRYFSWEHVSEHSLPRFLCPDHELGVVRCSHSDRVVHPDEEKPLSYQDREQFYDDLRRAMDLAFGPIANDPEALTHCFVESAESKAADSRLHRLATELEAVLSDAAAEYPRHVRGEVEETQEMTAKSVPAAADLAGKGCLTRLLGEPSAGKTVFLQRFYELTLDEHRDRLVLVWLDGERLAPFREDEVSRAALQQFVQGLFGEDGPEWGQLREVYAREWQAQRRLLDAPEDDKELRQRFVQDVVAREHSEPAQALHRYAAFAVRNRRRLPCFVIDNIDHLESPARALQWVVAIHSTTFALTTVSMEDTTLWRLKRGQRDQLGRHAPEQFWLYRPKIRDVVEKRRDYLQKLLGEGAGESFRSRTRVGRNRQWQWSVDADDLVRVVGAVLLDDQNVANWIGKLCNYDIGGVLELCKQIVLSPHVKAEELLQTQVTKEQILRRHVLKAIVTPKNEQFQGAPTDIVVNIFGTWSDEAWAPLLPARILSFLRAREDQERNRKEQFPGFVPVATIASTFGAAFGTPAAVLQAGLEKLSTVRLIETFDPSREELLPNARVRVTSRGRLHLDWSLDELTYIRLMAEVDPIVDSDIAGELRSLRRSFFEAMKTESGRQISSAEGAFVARYVRYLLQYARKTALPGTHAEVAPVRDYENDLEAKWAAAGE